MSRRATPLEEEEEHEDVGAQPNFYEVLNVIGVKAKEQREEEHKDTASIGNRWKYPDAHKTNVV